MENKNLSHKMEGGLRIKEDFKSGIDITPTPLISVITICFNSKNNIEETIQSVVNQSFKNFEYIIIDGGSTDGTVDIIRRYEDQITYWQSEPDEGISDAFNKGVRLSKGKYINFLNSDDSYAEKEVLLAVSEILTLTSPDIAYGKAAIFTPQSKEIYYIQGEAFKVKEFKKRLVSVHQAYFISEKYFKKYGLFNKNLRITMDYDHILRGIFEVNVKFMDLVIVNYKTGGESDSYKRLVERFHLHRKYFPSQILFPYYTFLFSLGRWIVQKILESLGLNGIVSLYSGLSRRSKLTWTSEWRERHKGQ